MKNVAMIALVMVLGVFTHAEANEDQSLAQEAALDWLALLDAGDYERSWEDAAELFKSQLSARQWAQAASRARKPLGDLQSREILEATSASSLPGVPDGDYWVLRFKAVYENKSEAVETVVPMLDQGKWRVSGYFIQ